MRLGRFLLVLGIIFLSLAGAFAQIAVFDISNGDVAGFKAALNTSNADNKDDIINLATNGSYALTVADNSINGPTGLPVIGADNNHTVIIHGHGSTITRSGSNLFRFFALTTNANLNIDNLT